MNIYEVGKMYPEMRNKADSLYLSIDGSGLMLISLLNKPTSKETQAFNRHSDLSVAAGRMFDLLYLCVKFGNLNWMDCTYTPHLGEIPNLPDATDGMGYALHICMFDTSTGVLKVQRIVSLDTITSQYIKKQIEGLKNKPFDKATYNAQLNAIYGNYSTKDLLDRAAHRFVLEAR